MEGICWKGFWRVSDRWWRRLGVVLEGDSKWMEITSDFHPKKRPKKCRKGLKK